MFTPPVQHSVSAVPLVVTVGAAVSHLPEVISVLVGLAALYYYWLVIGNLRRDRRERENAASTKPPGSAD